MKRQSLRSAYTLLEVLLALGIATLLLAGLYVSMDVQLSLAEAGRERVDESSLARALLNRIAGDIAPSLTPIRASAEATGTGGAAATESTTATTDPTTTTTNLNAVVPFNGGVGGDLNRLTMFISRAPGASRGTVDADAAPNGGPPDVRRVTYWRAEQGLARQEISRVTADDESTQLPPDVPDEGSFVISSEVDFVEFRYFDGTGWQESWDGTAASLDGATPIGPPRAIKITIGIRTPGTTGKVKTYSHVVSIQSANGQPPAPTTEATP